MSNKNQQECLGYIPFAKKWLKKPVILSLLMAFAIVLGAFLGRCYMVMPWDEWTFGGVSVAYWRKPIAVALLSSSIWVVSIGLGCLFWWLVSWVTGAGWSAGIRRIWENWANASLGGWIALISVTCILMTVLFPWADRQRSLAVSELTAPWFYSDSLFIVRQIGYAVFIGLIAVVARTCSLKSDLKDGEENKLYHRKIRLFSALILPVFVFITGIMSFDWIAGLSVSSADSMLPLIFLSYVSVVGLATSVVTCALTMKYRCGAGSGMEHGRLGALLLVAVLFKAYFIYGRVMLCWYAGLPEEQFFYGLPMDVTNWNVILTGGAVFVFLPMLMLLLPIARRSVKILSQLSLFLLLGSAVEIYAVVASAKGIGLDDAMLLTSFMLSSICLIVLVLAHVLCHMGKDRCFAVDHFRKIE